MAIKHNLSLDILDTACETVLKISDSSAYGQGLPVECTRLDVTLPGFYAPVYIENLEPGFIENITMVTLGYQNANADSLNSFSDGIYTIKYSVAPNDKVYVIYYHLRTTCISNEYYRELCKLQLAECEPSKEIQQKLKDLRYIKMLIDAAKAKAEYCNSTNQAIDMLAYARKMLSKYQSGSCITCNN
ncbi:MAG: hypothetical protein EOL97_16125 [Spirochaetia bacterium]|nr:hypothetical protein [Spirochaetia bacterium]